MTVVRVVAEQVEEPEEKIMFLGAINAENRLVPGEWMGYLIEDYDGPQKYPCVLVTDSDGARFDFCGWTLWRANKPRKPYLTNIFEKALQVGEYFTITDEEEGDAYSGDRDHGFW
ncbi:MAG: hypothetical protein ACYCXG_05040 [Acidiferrobacter sp.]